MSITSIIIILALIAGLVLVLRFLFGVIRIVVIIALVLLAIGLVYTIMTGNDVISPTMSIVKDVDVPDIGAAMNSAIDTVKPYINDTNFSISSIAEE